ncbi:MAG: hypothetical protein IKK42_04165 [Oscillospiraceae bacterium]|nr:hypothetical protein [Oscillospiraceae bacterium]
MFEINEYVVYGSGEICCIEEITERCFDGVHKIKYYKITPKEYRNSAYYVPVENAEKEIRRLLTKEEILEIIDSIPQAEAVWYTDKNERKSYFESVLRGDDFTRLVGMIKAIYEERQKRSSDGKKLIASDERAFSAAEHIIHGEIAFVLGIPEAEVGCFIRDRIEI